MVADKTGKINCNFYGELGERIKPGDITLIIKIENLLSECNVKLNLEVENFITKIETNLKKSRTVESIFRLKYILNKRVLWSLDHLFILRKRVVLKLDLIE